MLNLKGIERIKTSNNPQEAMNRFRSLRLQQQEPEPQVLGAGKIGCCRFQSIKNITNWLGLVKEEE
jgi:hypothetical protein